MLLKFYHYEVSLGKCLYGWHKLPRMYKTKADFFVSWLGGCIVWSRLKRTHKNTDGVQKD
jgi:hypothetical protein